MGRGAVLGVRHGVDVGAAIQNAGDSFLCCRRIVAVDVAADRQAILEILGDTKPDLPASFRRSSG